MKYLVTGGGGFIGSHLARHLAAHGNEVVVLDNFSTGRRENLAGAAVEVIEGDIRDPASVSRAVRGVDVVFHEAALCSVGRSIEDPLSTHAVNITGTLNVLEASRRSGVKRVVFASSSSVYGNTEAMMKDETMPTGPLSPYALSKLTGEYYCQLYAQLFGLETVVLRYFNVFGPRQHPDSEYAAVIPKFLMAVMDGSRLQIYGDGKQTRDFTFVDNVVQANVAAATSVAAAGRIMNVACGQRWSLLDLVGRLEAVLQCDIATDFHAARAGDIKHSLASIERARSLLGYTPAVDFDDGIKETVAWFFAAERAALTGKASPMLASAVL